ncbi:hypothetical protein [Georgenia halophila]|uniref:hypothetical protein n=1 Tax=Georgenia halophila TaxID=620889 RepID=UPI0031E7439C
MPSGLLPALGLGYIPIFVAAGWLVGAGSAGSTFTELSPLTLLLPALSFAGELWFARVLSRYPPALRDRRLRRSWGQLLLAAAFVAIAVVLFVVLMPEIDSPHATLSMGVGLMAGMSVHSTLTVRSVRRLLES